LKATHTLALLINSTEAGIEGDKYIEDHVTQWQEFITIKQGQEQEDPDSKVSVKISLDTDHKFIVTFVDEYIGYMWVYCMKNKDEMPKVIKQWMIHAYGMEGHNFRHGAGKSHNDSVSKEVHSIAVYGLAGVCWRA
jgi:hypothetical protein